MDLFAYRDGRLFCENVDVAAVAAEVGTPVYVYSRNTALAHYRKIAAAFAPIDPLICYSVKCCGNLHVLRTLAEAGASFDIVSGGELHRVLAAGGDPAKVVFAGVGKTDAEITEALTAGIRLFNAESEAELENLARIAVKLGTTARAALRVNPDVDPKTHRYTTTGKKETKFGVDIERARRVFAEFANRDGLRLEGIHLHIGSPVNTTDPYHDAVVKAIALIDQLREDGIEISVLNVGGGYGADYTVNQAPHFSDYAEAIVPLLADKGLQVILEPGRSIMCNAAVLVTQVQYIKQGGEKTFVICDASMTELIRPCLYQAYHFIWPAKSDSVPPRGSEADAPGVSPVDVVGGVCESSDFLAQDRPLPPVSRGDLLAVFSAGAYGFTMASQYNARPRPPEVLVDGGNYRIIRRRETYDDLTAAEREAE